MNIKVLYFTKYTRKGASSRLRCFQYFPYLKSNGVDVSVSPFFNDEYLEKLYAGRQSKLEVLKAYIKRFFIVFSVWKYDKIVIDDELFPYLPAWIEFILYKFGVKYIVDYDDAIFHNYDLNKNKWIRKFLSNKIDQVMRYSEVVVAGNTYLAERAKLAGAKEIRIIPTVIDLERYKVKDKSSPGHTVTIGWIGTKSTFKYLAPLRDIFERLAKQYNIKVHLIGVNDNMGLPGLVVPRVWTEETEVDEILKFDIGIMPLEDTPWEKGKCSYKLIQYMGCGLPVIASQVGMNTQVVMNHAFLIKHFEDWQAALVKYIIDGDLRTLHGQAGRAIIEDKYCLQKTQHEWLELLKS